MEALLAVFNGLGPLLQIVLLIVVCVIFWEPIAERIGWKPKGEQDDPAALLLAQMQTLTQHFNHDTTSILTDIRASTQKTAEALETMNKILAELMKDHAESQELLRQFDKFGVKVRDCDVD